MSYIYTARATVTRVIDADTIELDLDLGWRIYRNRERLRIDNLDSPNVHTDLGKAAKSFAESILPAGTKCTVVSKLKPSFERTIGDITFLYNGEMQLYSQVMIGKGHGRFKKYEG